MERATGAARETRASVATPRIRSGEACDWNDVFCEVGPEEVRRQLGEAQTQFPEDACELFNDPLPWPYPVTAEEVLNETTNIFNSFVIVTPESRDAMSLWVLFTYILDKFTISPMLVLSSPERRCGKTTTLSLLSKLCHRPLSASNITPAALFRAVEAYRPTLLIDEADTFLRSNDELRGILNSGHMKDQAFVIRTVGKEFKPKRFSTWGAKAIALTRTIHECGSSGAHGTDFACFVCSTGRRVGDQTVVAGLD